MTVSTQDLFGDANGAQPAHPGSYGQAPSGYRLPVGTHLGAVRLQVSDLSRSVPFYEDALGLRIAHRVDHLDGARVALAAHGDDRVLVELVERRGVRPAGRGLLGLYHFAILLPDRASLGRFVRHLSERRIPAGAGDHLVSEAFYLTDPDGLGIEVYADRPRETWNRLGRELMLSTDPVDVRGLVAEAGEVPWSGMPAGTVIGHVHLHVGSIEQAQAFYSEALGFDRMTWRYPGALFLGADGYHHHLGTNTWAGAGARPPAEGDARLLEWTIELPLAADVATASQSLADAGYPVESASERDGSVTSVDPWGTRVRLRAASAGVRA